MCEEAGIGCWHSVANRMIELEGHRFHCATGGRLRHAYVQQEYVIKWLTKTVQTTGKIARDVELNWNWLQRNLLILSNNNKSTTHKSSFVVCVHRPVMP